MPRALKRRTSILELRQSRRKQSEGFNARLYFLMLQKDLSQRTLAKNSGVSQSFICYLLNGNRVAPNVVLAIRIARAVGTSVEDIWGNAADVSTQQT